MKGGLPPAPSRRLRVAGSEPRVRLLTATGRKAAALFPPPPLTPYPPTPFPAQFRIPLSCEGISFCGDGCEMAPRSDLGAGTVGQTMPWRGPAATTVPGPALTHPAPAGGRGLVRRRQPGLRPDPPRLSLLPRCSAWCWMGMCVCVWVCL